MASEGVRTKTILVVEDELLIRLMLVDALRDAGFEVVEASNADDALATLESQPAIDLVFTDVRMPGTMDGVGLMKLLRETRPTWSMPLSENPMMWRGR
jgi:CheY-like chemotaxis protein